MSFLARCRLLMLEQKLKGIFGPFGKYNRYRRLCLERNSQSAEDRLRLAQEVLNGPPVSAIEAQDNAIYLREHGRKKPATVRTPRAVAGSAEETPPKRRKQA